MIKSVRILSLLMLAAIASSGAVAAEDEGVRIETKNSTGQSTGVVPITLDSKIKFTSEGMAVYNGESPLAAFSYEDCATITFLTSGSGVESVEKESGLILLTNPAYDQLLFSGFENASASLTVYSINGQRMLQVKDWQGQPVDVRGLTPGIYLISVNNSTFKFIKK